MAKKSLTSMAPEEEEILRGIVKENILEVLDELGLSPSDEDVKAMTDEVEEEIKAADEEEIKMTDDEDDTTKADDLNEDEIAKRVKRHFVLPSMIKSHISKAVNASVNRKATAQSAIENYKKSVATTSKKSTARKTNVQNSFSAPAVIGNAEKPSLKSMVTQMAQKTYKATNPYIGTNGGYLIGQEFASEILDPLRAQVIMFDMGVKQTMINNAGIYMVPKMTTAPTAYRPGINQAVSDSTPKYDMITAYLRPIAAQVIISKQMLATASFDFQGQVIDQLVKSLRLQIDKEILLGEGTVVNGTGAEIKGILSVLEENATLASTNIVTLATNGRKPKYTDLTAAETQINTGNVEFEDGNSGWVMHPRTRGTFRSLQTTTGEPLLQDNYGDKPYQTMNGYRVGNTTQVPINITTGTDTATSYVFGGNYGYGEYVMVNDIEIIVDETTIADQLQTRIIAYTYSDFIVHYPEAFYVMKGVSV